MNEVNNTRARDEYKVHFGAKMIIIQKFKRKENFSVTAKFNNRAIKK